MRWPWQKAPELNLGTPVSETDAEVWAPSTIEVPAEAPEEISAPVTVAAPAAFADPPEDAAPPVLRPDQRWERQPGADHDAIDQLAIAAQGRLPTGLLRFLGWSNGGEGPLAVEPGWIELDDASYLISTLEDPDLAVLNTSFLMIGKGRKDEWIALDLRADGASPVVWIDDALVDGFETFTRTADINAHVRPVAPDFDALLPLIGTALPQGED